MRKFLIGSLIATLLMIMAACGGSEPEPTATPEPTNTSEPTNTPEPTLTPTPSLKQTTLEGAQSAIVQIVAEGTFLDFEGGLQLNSAGAGSGFIIDPEGIVVTNNHVVTGAAILQVYVPGEDEPRNAKVLGVSECSDLAVIDIEGDGFPYLDWYQDEVKVGLTVFAAGYPLGDPEFTLTRGIVSKASTSGESNWASVDDVLEHDATINPGNSGGPLITENGEVVAVNYAGASSTNQYFAIKQEEALEVIEQLEAGNDVHSIGINGVAVSDAEGGLGIWVSSVDSGSPADQTGIEAGDLLMSMESLVLASDGTMADYCDILRSRDATDTMKVEIYRVSTDEVLEGQLNGRELEVTYSFSQELDSVVENEGTSSGPFNYVEVSDNSGSLLMEVPDFWNDVDGTIPESDSVFDATMVVSPDIQGYNESWLTPGVFFGVIRDSSYTPTTALDEISWADDCEYDARYEYSDPLYTGLYDLWINCGGEGTVVIDLVVLPEDQSYVAVVEIVAVTTDDLDVADQILATFVAE